MTPVIDSLPLTLPAPVPVSPPVRFALVACDPGVSGGFAIQEPDGRPYALNIEGDSDVLDLLRNIRLRADGTHCVLLIEDVPKHCGAALPASRIATLFGSYRFIVGAGQALGFAVHLIKPANWQKHFQLGTKRAAGSRAAWKRRLKDEAQRRFPGMKVTNNTADALLMLDYGRATLRT